MRLKINLEGFLSEIPELDAIPYLIKNFLKDTMDLDIKIDPKNPYDTEIESYSAKIDHQYVITEDEFYVIIDYRLKDN